MTDLCTVSKIDGQGNSHRCRREPSHSGEHRFSLTYCPATQGDCDKACVGSNCNRIEKPFSVEVADVLAEARHNAGTCPLSIECVLAEGHSGICELLPDRAITPDYYHGTTVDDFIAEFKLGFRLGSVIKYIARHEHKAKIQDLKKAQWYLAREIEKLEAK